MHDPREPRPGHPNPALDFDPVLEIERWEEHRRSEAGFPSGSPEPLPKPPTPLPPDDDDRPARDAIALYEAMYCDEDR